MSSQFLGKCCDVSGRNTNVQLNWLLANPFKGTKLKYFAEFVSIQKDFLNV